MPKIELLIRRAKESDHREILRLARQSKYTRDFGNHIFSGPEHYAKGWIRVAVLRAQIVGFTCFRHKVRQPETKLYFLGVDQTQRQEGVGRLLMLDLERDSPHYKVSLDCCKENSACQFYERLGYVRSGESLEGAAYRYEKVYK